VCGSESENERKKYREFIRNGTVRLTSDTLGTVTSDTLEPTTEGLD
jgi:hypothetical protein